MAAAKFGPVTRGACTRLLRPLSTGSSLRKSEKSDRANGRGCPSTIASPALTLGRVGSPTTAASLCRRWVHAPSKWYADRGSGRRGETTLSQSDLPNAPRLVHPRFDVVYALPRRFVLGGKTPSTRSDVGVLARTGRLQVCLCSPTGINLASTATRLIKQAMADHAKKCVHTLPLLSSLEDELTSPANSTRCSIARCKRLIPPLSPDLHKGQAGRIGVLGGSRECVLALSFV